MWIRRTVCHRRIVHWLWGQVGLQQLTTVRDHPTLNTLFGCAPIDAAEYQYGTAALHNRYTTEQLA